MTRVVWAAWVVCAIGGCSGPQYYAAPPEKIPPPVNVNGTTVQIIDQRPEWEKKPFTGVVCLYHLGKAHPDGWAQLAEETNAIVAALPQRPERVDVVISSFQLVRSGETVKQYRDLSTVQNPNPGPQSQGLARSMNDQGNSVTGTNPGSQSQRGNAPDAAPNKLEMAFAPKDDPRRMLTDHPAGVSCSIEATIRLVFPGGREQTIPVKTIARARTIPAPTITVRRSTTPPERPCSISRASSGPLWG